MAVYGSIAAASTLDRQESQRSLDALGQISKKT
jgi:hypothetical protein